MECAVVAQMDEADLVKPKAYIVLMEGYQADDVLAQELIDYARREMAGYKRPRWIEFVHELPKTATGKIQRFKLR
jgi:acyl-coenzyme A synthetase/AMP-(fatty) acid ligase